LRLHTRQRQHEPHEHQTDGNFEQFFDVHWEPPF
jgi:hypothetical protein